MAWVSLGSARLSWEWQSLPIADVNGEQFRILQFFKGNGIFQPSGYFLFSWIVSNGGRFFSKNRNVLKVYPDTQPRLIHCPIPSEYQEFGVRHASIKLGRTARFDPTEGWRIEVQYYSPIEV